MGTIKYETSLRTRGNGDSHNITEVVAEFICASGQDSGVATVFVPGSTAGVTTIEFEEGAVADLKAAMERIAPTEFSYAHDVRWGDGNGFSHVRAAILGPSVSVPFAGGLLLLGTWQQIILMDFDNRPRDRHVIVHVVS